MNSNSSWGQTALLRKLQRLRGSDTHRQNGNARMRRPTDSSSNDYTIDPELSTLQRSQADRTRQRRENQTRRRRLVLVITFAFIALFILSIPSLICASPYVHSLLAQGLAEYGFKGEAGSVQVGWITPLRVTGLQLEGERAGSILQVEEAQTTITILDLWNGGPQSGRFGDVTLRGVVVQCLVDQSWTSLEEDLADFMVKDPNATPVTPIGQIDLQDMTVRLIDRPTGNTWVASQTHGKAVMDAAEMKADIAGVLTQPGGGDGAINARLAMPASGTGVAGLTFDLSADSLPLSILALVQRRFPESELPAQISGDMSGQISVAINATGLPNLSFTEVQVRNLSANDPVTQRRLWQNQLATLRGDVLWQPGRIVARQISAASDFAALQMDGAFADSLSIAGNQTNPLAWLDQVDATAGITIDLARLQQAFPDLLPLRADAKLESGRIEARIEPLAAGRNGDRINAGADRDSVGTVRRRQLTIHCDTVAAQASGGPVRIAPIDVVAVVASDRVRLAAEQFRLDSPFGSIDGRGDLETGSAKLQLDFGKFIRNVRPLIDSPELAVDGTLGGDIRWDAQPDGTWRLRGDATAADVLIQTPTIAQIRQPSLKLNVDVVGRWQQTNAGGSLRDLDSAVLDVVGDGLRGKVELVQSVRNLEASRMIPLRVRTSGQLSSLLALAQPFAPESLPPVATLATAGGGFDFTSLISVSTGGATSVQTVDGQFTGLDWPLETSSIHQDLVKVQFEGEATLPAGNVIIRKMSLAGDAASAAVQGEYVNGHADIEIAWRAKLDRLQQSQKRLAVTQPQRLSGNPTNSNVRPANFSTPPVPATSGDWLLKGDVDGRCVVTGDLNKTNLELTLTVDRFDLQEPVGSSLRSVWAEPKVNVKGTVTCDLNRSIFRTDAIELSSDWFATNLTGTVQWDEQLGDVRIQGPAKIKMDEVAKRLTTLTGTTVVAEGIHQTPLEIQLARGADDSYAFTVITSLGWETADTAGMLFGPTRIPLRMTESTIKVEPSVVPILGPSRLTQQMIGPQVAPISNAVVPESNNQGEILLAALVTYRPNLTVVIPPGPVARGVRLTPDMTDKWLKYLAPIAADAARIEGVFGAELDEASIDLENQLKTRVRGRLNIDQVVMNAGPLADQMIASARQLQALASIGRAVSPPRTGRTLVTMPAQMVEFNVADGIVQHRALMLEIDRAKVITSGQVAMDGRLNLTAQVPLEASWLGSDLKGLEGQKLTLPIDGTLSRPSLDSAGVRRVVADLGTQAAQQAAGNYLQQQLGRGQQQLEGSLQKGIEKLGIERLFGK